MAVPLSAALSRYNNKAGLPDKFNSYRTRPYNKIFIPDSQANMQGNFHIFSHFSPAEQRMSGSNEPPRSKLRGI